MEPATRPPPAPNRPVGRSCACTSCRARKVVPCPAAAHADRACSSQPADEDGEKQEGPREGPAIDSRDSVGVDALKTVKIRPELFLEGFAN
eukprot:scaffold123516_cov30-Tisochrysis_lutea.AAC.1